MQPWVIVILIVVTCLTILLYVNSTDKSEGFADGDGTFYNQQSSYANRLFKRFQEQGLKAIFTQPGAPTDDINAAINSPDLYLPDAPDRDYSTYLTVDPGFKYVGLDNLCRGANMPKNLPTRIPQQVYNCAWWYIDDPATPSIGASGTVQGPIFPNNLPPNGEWVWDIATAQRMEEMKMCRRITNCDLIDAPGIKNVCGFCMSKGYAVPIDARGDEAYPDDINACGTKPARSSEACQPPPVNGPVTVDGVNCNPALGTPSPDNLIRLYTNNECDQMNGNWYQNGECLIRGGGSYSAACAINNGPASLTAEPERTICSPDAAGNLSRACLISLCKGLGYNPKGTVLRLLNNANSPGGNDAMAIQILRQGGINIPDAVFGYGNIDKESAIMTYSQIWNAMKGGSTALIRLAANYLVVGSENFDICKFDDSDPGPFPTMCVDRAFRMAGCQNAGTAKPTDATVAAFGKATWGDIKKHFANMYNGMTNGDSEVQDQNMKKCIGIKFVRDLPVKCDNPGMERMWYSAKYDGPWSRDSGTRNWGQTQIFYPAFMGRDILTTGWTQIANYDNTPMGKARSNSPVWMKTRMIMNPGPTNLTDKMDIWVAHGFRMAVNGTETFARDLVQNVTRYNIPVTVPAGQNNIVEIMYDSVNASGQLQIGGPAWDRINTMAQMPFPESAPVIAFDFFRGTDKDRHGTVVSMNVGASIAQVDGITSLQTGPNAYIKILTPLRWAALKTYTWYAKCNGPAETMPTVLSMAEWPQINTFDPNNTIPDTEQVRAISEFTARVNMYLQVNADGVTIAAGYNRNMWHGVGAGGEAKGNPNGWHHYAVQLNVYGIHAIHIDGKHVGQGTNPDLYANIRGSWTYFPDFIMREINIGRGIDGRFTAGSGHWRDSVLETEPKVGCCNGTMSAKTTPPFSLAFFHIYDRVLSDAEIKAEMNYINDPNYNAGPDLSLPGGETKVVNGNFYRNYALGWNGSQPVVG